MGAPPPLRLHGSGARAAWSVGLDRRTIEDEPDRCEDDFQIDPSRGVAVVASGRGAIGAQGRPAAVLAAWSVVGEASRPGEAGDARLDAGLRRAHEAVDRLTWTWRGPLKPSCSAAAMLLDGDRLSIAHVGAARISRIERGRVHPWIREHTVAAAFAAEGRALPPELAPVARAPTRSLGEGPPVHARASAPARSGDAFLIASACLHAVLDDLEIADALALSRPWTDDPTDLPDRIEALTARVRGAIDFLSLALALVRVVAEPGPRAAVGGSRRPAESWLFQPGRPLPEPPPRWRRDAVGGGPDRAWFDEVAGPLYAL
ncbi:MAG: hypothetical protein R3B09_33210 [Nannocystaceae bacterium]